MAPSHDEAHGPGTEQHPQRIIIIFRIPEPSARTATAKARGDRKTRLPIDQPTSTISAITTGLRDLMIPVIKAGAWYADGLRANSILWLSRSR
jgi:hypothetical protein